MTFSLKQFEIGPMQNFCYLIGDDRTKQALVVDPAWDKQKILMTVKESGLRLAGLVVSHAHFDHTNAIEDLLNDVDVPVYVQQKEVDYAKSGSTIVGRLGRTVKPLSGEHEISLGETVIRFLPTPGHTPGSQCLLVGNSLITGDTLFIGGCGRSDLPGGNAAALFESLQKIAKLPSETQICPGHDYGVAQQRSLGEEKKDNPYLRMRDVNEFLHAVA